jgi:two-component system sensor histidine kinase CreC
VSHELKTPIAVLLTEARRLQLQERSAEELSGFVGDVAEQMARLGKIVESFLTLARIDYEERLRKFEDFWFHDLLLEAVRRTRAQAATHEVHVDLELPEDTDYFDRPSWGDPELISSAVENLIRNAIRFAPAGSSVRVSLEHDPEVVAEVDPDRPQEPARPGARVSVSDEGAGMPQELLATVFEPFKQADSEEGRGRGTGLGLAIAHRVATLHKGSIRALNRPGRGEGQPSGCTVEVALPFLSEQDWGPPEPGLEGPRLSATNGPKAPA